MSVHPSSLRLTIGFLALLVALVATLAIASPAPAAVKSGKACVAVSAVKRPSPVRVVCRRQAKAPRALPSAVVKRPARRGQRVRIYSMMG